MLSTVVAAALALSVSADPQPELLWPKGAPHSVGDPAANQPSITAYPAPADTANGTAVVVCPGGGYGALAMGHEGKEIADWLNARGVSAFVLRYRIVQGAKRPAPLHPAPLEDVQRAIRTVRSKAKDWKIDPARVGIWGFSAGGHLASSAATHFDAGNPDATDSIDRLGCRPDFAILAYAVISMDPKVSHGGSRNNLLGKDADPKLIELMSNDKQVTKDTPPTFLFHTEDDKAVPVANSRLFHDALVKNGVPVEMHLYPNGPHGVGLASKIPALAVWTTKLEAWMKGRGLVDARR